MPSGMWHWQERFDADDPEEACRRQVLKVEKQISFASWLEHKKRAHGPGGHQAEEGDRERRREECEGHFKEWLKRKEREMKKKKKPAEGKRAAQLFKKPPSLHVNPRIKCGSQKNESTKANKGMKMKNLELSEAAVKAWEQRKRREDRVKRHHRILDEQLKQHAQKLLHHTKWMKKDVVCAYSTNQRHHDTRINTG